MVPVEVGMKTAFTLDVWWWGDGIGPKTGKKIPSWWMNFVNEYPDRALWPPKLKKYAKYRHKNNSTVRIVFHSPNDLSFFILRYS